MARTKSAVSTTSTVDEEKINEVEAAETTETTETKDSAKSEKKAKPETVWIQNPKAAYQRIRVSRDVYSFDGEGKAIVSAADSELFLKLPGYKLV